MKIGKIKTQKIISLHFAIFKNSIKNKTNTYY
jgi:hypothetical protein